MTVFNSLYAEHYDQFYAGKDYAAECDLVQAAIARFAGSPPETLLDVGCGTGSHAIALAARGYQMTGVDLSPAMIEIARAKSQALDTARTPTWICGDARTFEAAGPFDAAIMMFAVVGYLTANDDVLAGLRNIRRHLRPGAVFISDFWYGPSVITDRPTDRIKVISTASGQVIRATNTTLDIPRHTADVSFRLWTIDEQKLVSETAEMHRLRYFFPQEYALMLSQAGFEMACISAFPSLDQPLTDQSWNALVVAIAR